MMLTSLELMSIHQNAPKHINMCNHINVRGDPMPNMTLALPEDIYRIVKSQKEIRWSQIARQAIEDYAKKLEFMDELLKNSELTEQDAMELGKKVNQALHKRYLEMMEDASRN